MTFPDEVVPCKGGATPRRSRRWRWSTAGVGLLALSLQPAMAQTIPGVDTPETIPGVFSIDMRGPATKRDAPWGDGRIAHGFRSKVGPIEYYAFYYDAPATHERDSPKLLLEDAFHNLVLQLYYSGQKLVAMNSVANAGDAADDFTVVGIKNGGQGRLRAVVAHGRVFWLWVIVPAGSDQPDIWQKFYSSFKVL